MPGRTQVYGVRPDVLQPKLLQLDTRACIFELLLDLLGLVLRHAFLDRLGRTLDEVLGFLEAEAGNSPNLFNNVDLLGTYRRQDDVELGLFLGYRGFAATSTRGHHGHRRRGGNAPLLFKHFGQVGRLEHCQARKVVCNFLEICHYLILVRSTLVLGWSQTVSYTHLRAHETDSYLVCRLLL